MVQLNYPLKTHEHESIAYEEESLSTYGEYSLGIVTVERYVYKRIKDTYKWEKGPKLDKFVQLHSQSYSQD